MKAPSKRSTRKAPDGVINNMQGLDQNRMVVLSLKPRFAEAILGGGKTVEFRRIALKIAVPTRALLYAASPVRALLGTCIITSVQSLDPVTLWREHGSGSGLLYHEFQEYFDGVEMGTALTLIQPRAFRRRIPLQDLRAKPKGFRPPQSFAYVDIKTGDQLIRMAA